ncbi:unnamed protein product [Triticum turgidum subsp. durum]|uniref:CASP-like protein n=1 Tax=Triticum turgidum subsp. durum TaxID=4567 RepID=A0A9R0T7R5_TRITD|nr:unnamed protein product [Triticum turgidum subsp. durum]
MQSLVILVIASGMVACYSLLQGARCLVSIIRGGILLNRPLAWAIFSCDQQVMAYVIIGAVAVAMEAALLGKTGQVEFQWMKTCELYQRFCTQAGGGVACAVAASATMVGIALVSAFNLFRLYGHGKGSSK